MNKQLKEAISSPWVRIIQLLITSVIGLFLFFVVEAKSDLKVDIDRNSDNIESLEIEVSEIKLQQKDNSVTLKYIKEVLDEIKVDVKEIKTK